MGGGIPEEVVRWRAPRWVVAVAVLGATTPIFVAGVRATASGWMPVWDNAYPAIRAADVFSSDPPLLGTRSTASPFGGRTINHPGPLEFWILAPWVRLFGLGAGTALGVTFLNLVSVATVGWLGFRRAGQAGALVAMAAMATLAWSVGSSVLVDPWPPHVTLFPFAVTLMAAWSVADRDVVALPVLAASTSFVLQTHLGYTVLVPGLLLVSLTLFGWRRLPDRGARPWVVGALATGLVCWAGPLYEQVFRPGGNLRALVETAANHDDQTLSVGSALGVFAGIVVLPPWWLPPSFGSASTTIDPAGPAAPLALLIILAFGVVVGALARRARRAGRSSMVAGLVLVLVIAPMVVATLANVPSSDLTAVQPGYLRFTWVYSAFVGMVLVLALLELQRFHPDRARWMTRRGPVLVATIAVLAGLLALPSRDHAVTTGPAGPATRALADEVLPLLRDGETVLVRYAPPISPASWVGPGLMVELEAAGIPFVVNDRELAPQVGPHRMQRRGQDVVQLLVSGGLDIEPSSPTARLVAQSREPAVRVFLDRG